MGFWASITLEFSGDITSKLCPPSGPRTLPRCRSCPCFYCVCELFTCFVCCHPASETRQTSKLTQENKVQGYPQLPPLLAPCSRHYLLPHSLFLRGGSKNSPKIGQLFIRLGELWGHHKPPGVLVVERLRAAFPCLRLFFLSPGNCLVKGATVIEKAEPPLTPPLLSVGVSQRHRFLGFKSG